MNRYRYATQRAWLRTSDIADPNVAYLRGYNVSKDFEAKLQRLGKTAKKCVHVSYIAPRLIPSPL